MPARRQLETAITLYFNGGDPVSTNTLATSALEIIRNVNTSRGGSPMLSDLEASGVIRPHKIDVARRVFRQAQNFFKHADKDPEGVLDFNPDATAGYILDALEKYRELTGENPPVMRVFALWFRVQWTDLFIFTNGEEQNFAAVRKFYASKDKPKFFADYLPRYMAEAVKSNSN